MGHERSLLRSHGLMRLRASFGASRLQFLYGTRRHTVDSMPDSVPVARCHVVSNSAASHCDTGLVARDVCRSLPITPLSSPLRSSSRAPHRPQQPHCTPSDLIPPERERDGGGRSAVGVRRGGPDTVLARPATVQRAQGLVWTGTGTDWRPYTAGRPPPTVTARTLSRRHRRRRYRPQPVTCTVSCLHRRHGDLGWGALLSRGGRAALSPLPRVRPAPVCKRRQTAI